MFSNKVVKSSILAAAVLLGSIAPSAHAAGTVGDCNASGAHADWIQNVWLPMRDLRMFFQRLAA
jgi:hypothetical protein